MEIRNGERTGIYRGRPLNLREGKSIASKRGYLESTETRRVLAVLPHVHTPTEQPRSSSDNYPHPSFGIHITPGAAQVVVE
ncbi:hypothetical protein Pcinc_018614 [Petrolisthes cinctipes]|uniref:Uncharacterized protein n=1 Tax=Petrolisthes cinctipes TaxID=88211 RepID=A0AAE1FM64_PETCI|nr:hypothetical protein Pcinc_018614 [Petrolisthes cinctipes]